MNNGLVGQQRQIVEKIRARLDAVRGGDVDLPRVILLRGSSGVGKTRILQEVYETLRREARQPRYWPELSDAQSDATADPLRRRKVIAPEPASRFWPADSLPTFGWWGLNCQESSTGSLLDATYSLRQQWDAHGLALSIAKKESVGPLATLGFQRAALLGGVRDAFVSEGADTVLVAAMGAANLSFPFAGTLLDWGIRGIRGVANHRRERSAFHTLVDLGAEHRARQEALAQELADLVRNLSCPAVPGIVVVEDLHLMGPELDNFLTKVTTPDSLRPVLVIGTVWPEAESRDSFAQWVGRRPEGSIEVIDIRSPDSEDLILLLRRRAPQTDDRTARKIVEKYSTPLALEMWLNLKKVKLNIERNDGALVVTEALTMPAGLRGLMVERWNELPEQTRNSLAYATATNPLDDDLSEFLPDVVAEVVEIHSETPAEVTIKALEQAINPAWWCRRGADVQLFTEPMLAQTARELSVDELDAEARQELRELTEGLLRERLEALWNDDKLSRTVAGRLMALWYRELVGEKGADDWAWATATWLVAEQAAESGNPGRAAELGDASLAIVSAVVGPYEPLALDLSRQIGCWFGDAGAPAAAVQRLLGVYRDLDLHFANRHPLSLAVRFDTARYLGKSGKPDMAVEILEELVPLQEEASGEHSEEVIGARVELARWLWRDGKPRAIILANETLGEVYAFLGSDHPLGMQMLSELADWNTQVGLNAKARELLEDLLIDQQRILGADSPKIFETLAAQAIVAGNAGDWEASVGILETAVREAARRFGIDHPVVLQLRNDQAFAVCATGDVTEGLHLLKQLLPHQQDVLGESNLETLTTRNNIAYWLANDGQVAEAIRLFKELHQDQLELLEPGHPHLLRTREALDHLGRSAS